MTDEQSAAPIEIHDRESFKEWLNALPAEQSIPFARVLAARAALRVAPTLVRARPAAGQPDAARRYAQAIFAVFWANALTWVAAFDWTRTNKLNPRAAVDAAATYDSGTAYAAVFASTNAAAACADAANAAAYAAHAAAAAADAAAIFVAGPRSDSPLTAEAIYQATHDSIWTLVRADASMLLSGRSPSTVASDPLWIGRAPDWASNAWDVLKRSLDAEHWKPWRDWYQRRLDGKELSEEIEFLFGGFPVDPREKGVAEQNVELAEKIAALEVKTPPEIPKQGPGPHLEIDAEIGAIVPAKPESLDIEGNNVARLEAHHPQVKKLAGDLVASISENEQPELFSSVSSYFANVNRELRQIDFDRVWGEGVFLEEFAAAAERGQQSGLREPLSDVSLATLKALLKVHGPFVLSSRAGLENLALANAFEQRDEDRRQENAAAQELAREFKSNTDIVSADTTAIFEHFIEQPESTAHPQWSAAFKSGMARNVVINLVAGAAVGGIIGTVGAYVAPAAGAATGMALLPVVEGWKKSKPFLEVSGLVTEGMNDLSEADIKKQWSRLHKVPFERYKQFVIMNEDRLRRLLGNSSSVRWLHEYLDWLKRQEN